MKHKQSLQEIIAEVTKDPIPHNLDAALEYLKSNVPESGKDRVKNCQDVAEFHFTTGMAMRNMWELWDKRSILNHYFNSIGIFHADDMSAIIMESFKRILNGEPIELDKQVKFYKDYWAKHEKD